MLGRLMSRDIVWHQPGQNRFSGTHRGRDAVVSMIGGMMDVSGGTFAITRAVRFLENGGWVAVDLEFQAQRDGMGLAQAGIDLLCIENDQIVEARLFSSDQDAEDTFGDADSSALHITRPSWCDQRAGHRAALTVAQRVVRHPLAANHRGRGCAPAHCRYHARLGEAR